MASEMVVANFVRMTFANGFGSKNEARSMGIRGDLLQLLQGYKVKRIKSRQNGTRFNHVTVLTI